jgi:thiol-disulfide isomerase/thioredoxin
MVRLTRAALISAAILAITPVYASAATETAAACSIAPEALHRFELSADPAAVPEQAFLEDGETERTLADWQGRPVVLNFWATWCPPCVKEMPALDALNAALAADGIDVLTVSNDFGGVDVVRKFYAANGIEHLPALTDQRGRLAQAFKLPGLPTTILIDRAGREIARVVGPAEWDDPTVASFLRACLAPAA